MSDKKMLGEAPERSLDELVEDMTKECGMLPELGRILREAELRVRSCKCTISDLQKKIENRVEELKANAALILTKD